MPDIGSLHPQIVHFVIVGAGLGIFFRWVSLTGKLAWTGPAATTLILIGTVAAVLAVRSGDDAHGVAQRIPGAETAVRAHESAGHDAQNILLLIAALEIVALVPVVGKWRRGVLATSALVGLGGAWEVYNVGRLGGEVVYTYAGGVGLRSGDSTDVDRLMLAALYNRAQLDRTEKNSAGAAQAFADLATRFPADPAVQMLAVESLLQDKKDPAAALAALNQIPAPPDSARTYTRYQMDRADAMAGSGQKDSARAVLTALSQKFPKSQRIKDRLAKMK
jgi:uncharacterized membrane protein